MIKLYIPSYNRPCQLYTLLESIDLNDKEGLFDKISVYYQGTTNDFQEGYKKLINEKTFLHHVEMIPKSNSHFKDVMSSFDEQSDYWSMTTDDSLFYRPFNLTKSQLDEVLTESVDHLSFRLGFNTTTIDYEHPEEKSYFTAEEIKYDLIKFYRANQNGHYGHPFAVDSYLSKTEHIKQIMIKACSPSDFNYRYMECKLSDYLRMNPNKPFVICPKMSWLVNSPSNMVSDGPYCKNGVQYKFTIEELNQKWLDGYKIDLSSINKDEINSVQQELPYRFIKYEN